MRTDYSQAGAIASRNTNGPSAMKRRPLQSISMAQVFAGLATMSDDVFEQFRQEATGTDAFDSDKERVEPLALRLGLDVDTATLIFGFLSFLYDEIHDDSVAALPLDELISQVLETAKKTDVIDKYLAGIDEKRLTVRLMSLLGQNSNISIYNKSKKLKSGFVPVAIDFKSFVDLRPLLTEDRQAIAQLIPIVQFMITSESSQPIGKSYVFQMDRRRLKALKDAVDAALQKLDVIADNKSVSDLIK